MRFPQSAFLAGELSIWPGDGSPGWASVRKFRITSTFSKNRHGRLQESKLLERWFEQMVRQCVEVGLVQGKHLSVDGSFVEANAAKESRIPREQLAEAAQVHQTVRQYLQEVEERNPVEKPVHDRIRYRPPIPIPLTPPRPVRQPDWVITTTTW